MTEYGAYRLVIALALYATGCKGVAPCMEGVVAVSRHLLGAMWRKPSAEFKIMAKQQSRTCLERAGTASCCIRMEWCFSLMSGVSPY